MRSKLNVKMFIAQLSKIVIFQEHYLVNPQFGIIRNKPNLNRYRHQIVNFCPEGFKSRTWTSLKKYEKCLQTTIKLKGKSTVSRNTAVYCIFIY